MLTKVHYSRNYVPLSRGADDEVILNINCEDAEGRLVKWGWDNNIQLTVTAPSGGGVLIGNECVYVRATVTSSHVSTWNTIKKLWVTRGSKLWSYGL